MKNGATTSGASNTLNVAQNRNGSPATPSVSTKDTNRLFS